MKRQVQCDRCGGNGTVNKRPCPKCGGEGRIVEHRSETGLTRQTKVLNE